MREAAQRGRKGEGLSSGLQGAVCQASGRRPRFADAGILLSLGAVQVRILRQRAVSNKSDGAAKPASSGWRRVSVWHHPPDHSLTHKHTCLALSNPHSYRTYQHSLPHRWQAPPPRPHRGTSMRSRRRGRSSADPRRPRRKPSRRCKRWWTPAMWVAGGRTGCTGRWSYGRTSSSRPGRWWCRVPSPAGRRLAISCCCGAPPR
jgi:hypothetical protein